MYKPTIIINPPVLESMKHPIVIISKAIITVKFPIWSKDFLPNFANRKLLKIPPMKFNKNRKIGIIFFNYGKTKDVINEP